MRTPRVRCVAWRPKLGAPREWCAAKGTPDPDAWSDPTLCGHYVTLRIGTESRVPTCPECKQILRGEGK